MTSGLATWRCCPTRPWDWRPKPASSTCASPPRPNSFRSRRRPDCPYRDRSARAAGRSHFRRRRRHLGADLPVTLRPARMDSDGGRIRSGGRIDRAPDPRRGRRFPRRRVASLLCTMTSRSRRPCGSKWMLVGATAGLGVALNPGERPDGVRALSHHSRKAGNSPSLLRRASALRARVGRQRRS